MKYAKNELSVFLLRNIKPGEIIDINLGFTVPSEAGIYMFLWKLKCKNVNIKCPELGLQITVIE